MTQRTNPPEQWKDLPMPLRAAIVAQAEDRLWWEGTKARLRAAGPWASWIVVLVGAGLLLRDQFVAAAAWIAGAGR
jgi:hypothetical protein